MNIKDIASVSLVLFAVIDILGSIPLIIEMRQKYGKIQSEKATLVAGLLMIVFLFLGEQVLKLFGLDIQSFALAGALIMFFLGMEMVLGITFFKQEKDTGNTASIVPLAFPSIAGAGTMTTLISLKAEFETTTIIAGIFINLVFVYIVLKSSSWIENKLGAAGTNIIRKVFGIILLAISIKIFKTYAL